MQGLCNSPATFMRMMLAVFGNQNFLSLLCYLVDNPLKYILTKPKIDAVEQRWVARLVPYDFDIQYIPGPKNVVADALSRLDQRFCIG